MHEVYSRLKAEGLEPSYVKKVILPDWWDDSLAATKSGFFHGLSFIAERAGIEVAGLVKPNRGIECRDIGQVKFKKPRNVGDSHIKWAKNIAASAAQIIAGATKRPVHLPQMSAAELRRSVMEKSGGRSIGLTTLLDLAWHLGIPVLFITHLPPRFRRMDGMAARIDGRPVIVTSKKSVHTAILAFVIAHELGHICRGHVQDGVLVDEQVDGGNSDPEEREANAFAVELLTGSPASDFHLGSFLPATMVYKAKRVEAEQGIDPGVVILNHAFHRAGRLEWGMVFKALKQLEPDADAPRQICERMLKELDLEGMDEDQREYIEKLSSPADSAVPL